MNKYSLSNLALQEMLSNVGFNDGIPIDEAFFQKNISGRHNPDIAKDVGMSAL